MADESNIVSFLQQLMQKNRTDVGVAPAVAPQLPQNQGQPSVASGLMSPQFAKNGSSILGFLGGLGDTPAQQGPVQPGQPALPGTDSSLLTQLNQYLMKQTSQASGQAGNLPGQTPAQSQGQSVMGTLASLASLIGF